MHVVIDTNVLVSGIFFGGKPNHVFVLIQKRRLVPCFTVATWKELESVLQYKKFEEQRRILLFTVEDFLKELSGYSLIFPDSDRIPIIIKEDPPDNHILACALLCGASHIISGDKHLLKLKKFNSVSILTPAQFLRRIQGL